MTAHHCAHHHSALLFLLARTLSLVTQGICHAGRRRLYLSREHPSQKTTPATHRTKTRGPLRSPLDWVDSPAYIHCKGRGNNGSTSWTRVKCCGMFSKKRQMGDLAYRMEQVNFPWRAPTPGGPSERPTSSAEKIRSRKGSRSAPSGQEML